MLKSSLLLTAIALVLASAPANAEETRCTGTIGAVTLDNIRVPDGRNCILNGTRAKGTVKVGTGSALAAHGVQVNGNIQAEGSSSVVVRRNSFVGGSVQIKQGAAARVEYTRINGDLLFDENRGALIARYNTIGGNLQAFKNTGGLSVVQNRIDGNLQCKENRPAPTGGGNVADSKEDQCSRL
jgi:hypothetical protein